LRRRATREGDANSKEETRGYEIGSALKVITLTTATAMHAVDEWAHGYPEVQEVMREHTWFRPLVETIAMVLFKNSKLGLKARVTFGAVTSMTDLLTDIYVTYTFWSDGKGGYFKASLASLAISIGLQLFLVWGQNRKLGMKRVLREWVPILLGFKPAVDAYRVATGVKQEVGATFDPLTEMATMKMLEMFTEAIPGVIIQLTAIANITVGEDISRGALFSLAISALTTGFASATVSYDMDTDPGKRSTAPEMYGYVPGDPKKRSLVFAAMTFLSAGMLLIRCMTIVILGLLGGRWPLTYIGADLGLFLVIKLLRRDFWYWIPAGGNTEVFVSIIARFGAKIVTDFTSLVFLRHPNEVGGLNWMLGFLLTMGSLPVAIIVAQHQVEAERGIELAWEVAKYFIPFTIGSFAVFFLNIDRKYWHTFFNVERAKDFAARRFKETNEDSVKANVLTNSRHLWEDIKGDVKEWVQANWHKWEEEKPDWFHDQWKPFVPVEFIPITGDARRRESIRRASVDADADAGLGGALRASIRRASVELGVGIDKARVVPTSEGAN
jgi:hypothetical protein